METVDYYINIFQAFVMNQPLLPSTLEDEYKKLITNVYEQNNSDARKEQHVENIKHAYNFILLELTGKEASLPSFNDSN